MNKKQCLVILTCLSLCSCSGTGFESLGQVVSQGMSAAGVGGGYDVESLFSAGSKISKAGTGLNESQEYYLGRAVAANILNRYSVVKNPALQSYVQRVGNAVVAFSTRPETYGGYHFAVIESDELNALSAPGGFVFISKGLLKVLPSEDALAAVLAHEVGHVALGHGVKAISQANLTQALTLIGKQVAQNEGGGDVTGPLLSAFGDSVKEVTDKLLSDGYSRSQEYDADRYSAEVLRRAGFDPMAILAVFSSLEEAKKSSASGGWFSTHPAPSSRRSKIEDSLSPLPAAQRGNSERLSRFEKARKAIVG